MIKIGFSNFFYQSNFLSIYQLTVVKDENDKNKITTLCKNINPKSSKIIFRFTKTLSIKTQMGEKRNGFKPDPCNSFQ